jgi:hypothetical protein
MLDVATLTQIYSSAALRTVAAKTSVYLLPVFDLAGSSFRGISLGLSEREPDEGSPLAAFCYAARGFQWALLTDPVPMAAGNAFASEKLRAMKELLPLVTTTVSKEASARARELVCIAELPALQDEMPLTDALLGELDVLGDSAIVVVPRARQVEALRAWLTSKRGTRVEVLSASFASSEVGLFTDTYLALGPPEIYSSQGRSTLGQMVRGPGSEVLSFLYPTWSRPSHGPRVSPISSGSLSEMNEHSPSYFARECEPIGNGDCIESTSPALHQVLPLDRSEVRVLLETIEDDAAAASQGILIECLRVELAQGFFAFLEEGTGSVRTVRIDGNVRQIIRRPVSHLEVGEVLSLRIGTSEPTELRQRALEILGRVESEGVMASQGEWKQRLGAAGDLYGWHELDGMLRKLGVIVEGQEKRWATPLAIRPRSDSDFRILLTFLGYDEGMQAIVVANARRLLKAVREATYEMTAQLQRALVAAAPNELRDGCSITIVHEGRFLRSVFVGPIVAMGTRTHLVTESSVHVALGGGQ